MSKQTRAQKKEEERRILAEMEDAMQEQAGTCEDVEAAPVKEKKCTKENYYSSSTPSVIHCKRCKTLMENGVCPTCGFRVYQAMSEEKRRKIKGILTAVLLGVALIVFVIVKTL